MARAPLDELDELQRLEHPDLEPALTAMALARVRGDVAAQTAAFERLRAAIAETVIYADMLGRRRTLLIASEKVTAAKRSPMVALRADPAALFAAVPRFRFGEMIADLLRRVPVLARTASQVAEEYARGFAFACARAAEVAVTRRVQDVLQEVAQRGEGAPEAERRIVEETGWTRGYAETVFATNTATAYSAGRIVQGLDPEILDELPAWEFVTAGDSDVRATARENHRAAHGLIAAKDDPIWNVAFPPCGYGCRCSVEDVGVDELRARGLLIGDRVRRYEPPGFAAFKPHPNFGRGRPDLRVRGAM